MSRFGFSITYCGTKLSIAVDPKGSIACEPI